MGSHPKSSPYHDVDAPDWYALGRYRASPPGERGYNSSIPTPRERRSPSVTDRSEKTSAGQAAPTMHTGGSTASLLQPPPTISHRYSQISLSQTSLGGGFTATQNRRVSKPIQDCAIVRFHERDDVEQWSGLKRYVYRLAPFLILADVLLYLVYLGLRLYCNIDVQRKTNIDAGPAWVFIAVELLITIPYLMNNFWAMFALKKRNRPRLRLAGDDVPTVDVLVTCCREDDGVIMDTVRGACDQDYPTDRFRVIILDDGGSESLKKLAYEASQMFPNLYYMARQKIAGVPHHFKAGNLNYGLEQGTFLPGGASEFVAALDADMVSVQVQNPEVEAQLTRETSRSPSPSGCAPSSPTSCKTARWAWLVHRSSSTTRRGPTPWVRASTSSSTSPSPSRILSVRPGARARATSAAAKPSRTLAAFLSDR